MNRYEDKTWHPDSDLRWEFDGTFITVAPNKVESLLRNGSVFHIAGTKEYDRLVEKVAELERIVLESRRKDE